MMAITPSLKAAIRALLILPLDMAIYPSRKSFEWRSRSFEFESLRDQGND
jgi:hypothetical protein